MNVKMISAAVVLIMSTGGAWATLPEECSGKKMGWTSSEVTAPGGDTSTECYRGASGNDVDCDAPGNHVVVTVTSGSISYTLLTQPGGGTNPQTCIVPGTLEIGEPTCDVSRTNEASDNSSTAFSFYCD